MTQQGATLEYQANPERLVRFTQRTFLLVAWVQVPITVLLSYLRHGDLRYSTVVGALMAVAFTGMILAYKPRQIYRTMTLPQLTVNTQGIQFRLADPFQELGPIRSIPWDEIINIRSLNLLGLEYLQLIPRDKALIKERFGMSWLLHWYFGTVIFPTIAFGSSKAIAAQINDFRKQNAP